MQQDQVEVAFCDLCGTSVPDVDFGMGMATRLQGKTIGKCCLSQLRAAAPGVAAATAGPATAGTHDPRLVPVAIAMLAAVAAATIFLDYQFAESDRRRVQEHSQVVQSQRADHDAIQRIDVAMDGAARRADLDGFVDKVGSTLAGTQADAVQSREQVAVLQKDIAALQREVRAAVTASIDYRPLFDDLRTTLQRQGAVIAELRAAGAGTPVAPVEAASAPKGEAGATPGEGAKPPAADALPAALAETAKKLASPDPAVRFEAVDELLHSKNPLVLPHLLPLARDADSFVRRLTVEGLRDFKRPEAVDALLGALADGDERVRDYAWRSLVEMTGQKIAFEAGGSKDARARAVTRWQEWWEKNKATFGS